MTAEERVLFYYENLDDEQLVHHILYELDEIEPKYVTHLTEIVERRGLDPKLTSVIETFNASASEDEITNMCQEISHFDCPICGQDKLRLNAVYAYGIKSHSYVPQVSHMKLFVGCSPCLTKVVDKAYTDQILFAILITIWFLPRMMINNRKCKQQLKIAKQGDPTPAFREFVKRRRGLFAYRDESIEKFRNMLFRL